MIIRPPTLAESYRIIGLLDQSLRGRDDAYDQLARNALRRWLARHLTLPLYFHFLNEAWVAMEGSEVVGWLFLIHRQQTTHLNDIGVHPAFQRRGVGTALLAWAKERARGRGKQALTLAVTGSNQPAVRLYERSGFRPVHHHLWHGAATRLPLMRGTVQARLLDDSQRLAPFRQLWPPSLAADGQPVEALLADQAGHWYSARGMAWELWQSGSLVGYADLIGPILRLFPADPHDPRLLQTLWSALRPTLAPGSLALDLGSDAADGAAQPLLAAAGWVRAPQPRLLMVAEGLKVEG